MHTTPTLQADVFVSMIAGIATCFASNVHGLCRSWWSSTHGQQAQLGTCQMNPSFNRSAAIRTCVKEGNREHGAVSVVERIICADCKYLLVIS